MELADCVFALQMTKRSTMRYAFLALVLVSGCAGMTETACRGSNWYDVGERDGLAGVPPRIDTYAYQCGKHNVQLSQADYMNGWWLGNAVYRERSAPDAAH
jgi:hypothetical protein